MKTGRTSLYLDIYYQGVRRYEYLHLYLEPDAPKAQNRETMRLAKAICAKRITELRAGLYNIEDMDKQDTHLLAYYRHIMETRQLSVGSRRIWASALQHLSAYATEATTFRQVTPRWVQGFSDYLLTARSRRQGTISPGSQWIYFARLKACIHQAMTDGILTHDPTAGLTPFRKPESRRVYLTLDELRHIAITPFHPEALRRAFLFSCLTGLRKSDIQALTWGNVSRQGDFVRLTFRQRKTGGQEYIDLTPQAVTYMGEPAEPQKHIFSGFGYGGRTSTLLQRWCEAAGCPKPGVTFHSGRHTFAVMMLELGADLYTVSKLLGHREIKTTQVYAHVIDKTKQAAALLIPELVPGQR